MRVRIMLSRSVVLAAIGLVLGSAVPFLGLQSTAFAQPAATPTSGAPARARAPGYLSAEQRPDHKAFLPPPPEVGSPLGKADVAIFEETRALANGPRWQLATSDDRIGGQMLSNFSCAVGLDFAAVETPALARVIQRAGADLFPLVGAAKDLYQRPRPFVTEEGPVCITPSESFAKSGSYPSGHSASGWLHALLLAEVDPDNAAAIVNRGRAFGESRVVCGVHYLSDVEAGRLTATALVAALHGNAEFEADMDAARAELAALRSSSAAKPDGAACAATQPSLATPW